MRRIKPNYYKYLDSNAGEATKNYVQAKQEMADEHYYKEMKEEIEKEIIEKINFNVQDLSKKPLEELEQILKNLCNGK